MFTPHTSTHLATRPFQMVRLGTVAVAVTALVALTGAAAQSRSLSQPQSRSSASMAGVGFVREAGRCAMYDSCGRKSTFGGELPCPDNELAREVSEL